MFKLESKYTPSGDQPQAIEKLVKGIKNGKTEQVLMGATGTGKTFTMENIDIIKPVFHITEVNKKNISEIEKKLDLIIIDNNDKKRKLQIKSKVRSIHSSLAIEANSLSLESVESIVENKIVLGNRKEIQEVKNANELYEHISEYNWKNENDFLKAHTLLMKYFDDDNGYYRNHGEGVKKGNKIIYSAPQSILVPSLMKSLFEFMIDNENKIHPLILSSIFHYYFVYVHPFSERNGIGYTCYL